ncbi:Cytochrome b5 [Hondaea fermentalgiana]|uniref:Cytochrome b5 n=1 Tax=Hondaea fermentalgiana TaxID=2315210 RepID=A0A2R5G7C3_9STRA|nr:Cytochrome b5 [Hondaea fermentalgiana]|eukprot:GBG24363.1 Cytochrome b5 [Hondaea fermentalgiana]
MPWVAANNRHSTRAQIQLRVVNAEQARLHEDDAQNAAMRQAAKDTQLGYMAEKAFRELAKTGAEPNPEAPSILVFARTHPQFVLRVKPSAALPEDSICLDDPQCRNFEVVVGEDRFPWSRYDAADEAEVAPLQQVLVEVRPRNEATDETIVLERADIRTVLSKALFQQIITNHERIHLAVKGTEIWVYIKEVVIEEDPQEDEEKDLFLPDIVRGRVETTTQWHIEQGRSTHFELKGDFRPFERKPPTNIVHVTCSDDEYFPVKKRLLQPCIALARTVLSPNTESITVDLDCCLFDKVLIYLEAEAKGLDYEIDLHEADELLPAAKKLRLIGLQRVCEKVRDDFSNSLRLDGISFEEVKRRNAEGELLLIIDNQVCDVTDWLELHPGGNTIIPEQALNVDATVLFEVYHASRESFLFLKQLFIGPLLEEDHAKVPPPQHTEYTEPSESFLAQFREFMGQIKQFKSF